MKKLKVFMPEYLLNNAYELPNSERHCFNCGSCYFTQYAYGDIVNAKREWLEEIFTEAGLWNEPIYFFESPKQTRYRSKMDFVVQRGKAGLRKGSFAGVYDVIDSCIAPEKMSDMLNILREFSVYPTYNPFTHEGVIRYYVMRSGVHEGKLQLMLTIIVKDIPEFFVQDLIAFLKDSDIWNEFTSINICINNTKSDVSFGEVAQVLKEETISQDIICGGQTFVCQISANSFFQSNASVFNLALEYMHSKIEEIDDYENLNLYDIFGGTGVIGMALSQSCKHVITVELEKENTELASKNIKVNNIKNQEVITADAFEFLSKQQILEPSLFVFDPPRTGLGKKTVAFLKNMERKPKYILYMSCNAETQCQDLDDLKDTYNIIDIAGFDMFPYTPHLETVAILEAVS